jgi:thiol-disulfide isomerase/thioredoxin
MNKSLYVLAIVLITMVSCKKEEPKDYVTLSGKILNPVSDTIFISSETTNKKIILKENGVFSDTLKVKTGQYMLSIGNQMAGLYLKNNEDLEVTLDYKDFNKTLIFNGTGALPNTYLAKKMLIDQAVFSDTNLLKSSKDVFIKKINELQQQTQELLDSYKDLDTAFVSSEKKEMKTTAALIMKMYDEDQYLLTHLSKGKKSPEFKNYENYEGGTLSLNDLKGKYVYIDLWATWCGPCKAEIPFLKLIEKEYHGKKISFVSISVDSEKDHEKWKKMVKEKELTGIQLFSKEDKVFTDAYKLNGIPRFILIDPNGDIVDSNAPRPSDEKLKIMFNELRI